VLRDGRLVARVERVDLSAQGVARADEQQDAIVALAARQAAPPHAQLDAWRVRAARVGPRGEHLCLCVAPLVGGEAPRQAHARSRRVRRHARGPVSQPRLARVVPLRHALERDAEVVAGRDAAAAALAAGHVQRRPQLQAPRLHERVAADERRQIGQLQLSGGRGGGSGGCAALVRRDVRHRGAREKFVEP
jgi:hypothetical protein